VHLERALGKIDFRSESHVTRDSTTKSVFVIDHYRQPENDLAHYCNVATEDELFMRRNIPLDRESVSETVGV
jgi:hypothetical protein